MGSPWWEGGRVTERQRYRAEDLHEFCCAVLQKLNVPREDAQEVRDCLILADLRGDSHGVIRLPVYALRIRKSVVNAGAMPRIIRTRPAAALMDGDNGLGAVVGSRAMEKAIELATTAGIGRRRSTDEPLRDRLLLRADGPSTGFIGCAASNAPPHMAPFGGRARFLGTNPFSIGIPVKEEAPLLFDASTSLVARGKIIVAAQEGGRFRLAGQSIRKATQRQTQRRRLPDQCCRSEVQKVRQSLWSLMFSASCWPDLPMPCI
jgi:LDH2 family malate/lactate/ureidoglycolate dehydrogenase